MDSAIDQWLDREVTAREVARGRGLRHREFFCPKCNAPVDFRAGRGNRRDYFAHRAGYADDECELYFPGEGTSGSLSQAAPNDGVAEPALYLQVIPAMRGLAGWRLALAVPRAPTSRGKVTIVEGERGRVEISGARLATSTHLIPVRPSADRYSVVLDAALDETFRRRLSDGAGGLDSSGGTVFRGGPSGGRRIGRDGRLLWAADYFAVWPTEIDPFWPRGILIEKLASVEGFSAARFTLPADPSSNVREWAARFLDRAIDRPLAAIQLVLPSSVFTEDGDLLVVEAGEELVVGITAVPGAPQPTSLTLFDQTARRGTRTAMRGARGITFVSLGRIPAGDYELYLGDGTERDETIAFVARSTAPTIVLSAIHLEFRRRASESDSSSVKWPLHARALSHELSLLSQGISALAGIDAVPGVRLSVFIDTADGRRHEFIYANDASQHNGLASGVTLDALNEAALHANKIQLDAGAFGRAIFESPVDRQGPRPKGRCSLPPATRARAKWLLGYMRVGQSARTPSSSASSVTDNALRTALAAILPLLNEYDRMLLRQLAGVPSFPPMVRPQLRSLSMQLNALFRQLSSPSVGRRAHQT